MSYGSMSSGNGGDRARILGMSVLAFSLVALFILACVGLGLGGWQAGWWFSVQNAKRQGQIINIQTHNQQGSYGAQLGDITQLNQNIAAAASAGPGGQAIADVNNACAAAALLTGEATESSYDKGWVSANCLGGGISPKSRFNG
jgi:hypothetical protein